MRQSATEETSAMRSFLFAAGLAGTLVAGEITCTFTPTGWKPGDWVLVKSPRWSHRGTWVQEADAIRNATPSDATAQDMLGKRAGETYTSMVLKQAATGNLRVESTMSFAHRMAPLIVLAPVLGEDREGSPEYREHWEIVLFDQGVNVWHHVYENGKPSWRKAAFARFPVKAGEKHKLSVTVKRVGEGAQLTVRVGDHEMGYLDEHLPESLHVGLTGCEGTNRFYDFRLTQGK
jgi:hypothetical protein